ncbi:MAG: lipoprotein [Xanthomonadaceae bacterium]|jgi:predicted small lipoprotein YifL|nr:lipoprotein [Xanthomonadaceae bacterium]MDP2185890.1 lipoprotein [Xanthomonadales bacterium]MDZ4116302.1 lipoprotein [Xanthomonadaceae bacterium]MDZ4377937.1 lipoprotein [Xanthomonadaceae bacterium]
MKTTARFACLLIALALLAACGNKGPLVLPPPDAQSATQ